MWSFYGMITLVILSVVVSYGVLIVLIRPNPNKASEASIVRLALKNIGVEQPSWHTMAVSASRDVSIPADALWETWSRLEEWGTWSTRHSSARWIGESQWQVGASFEQTQWLGFPLGRRKSIETISEVNPGRKVRWCKSRGNLKSCHVWTFTLLPNRRVRIATTLVQHGTAAGLLKPILYWQWQRQFDKSLDSLIRKTQETL